MAVFHAMLGATADSEVNAYLREAILTRSGGSDKPTADSNIGGLALAHRPAGVRDHEGDRSRTLPELAWKRHRACDAGRAAAALPVSVSAGAKWRAGDYNVPPYYGDVVSGDHVRGRALRERAVTGGASSSIRGALAYRDAGQFCDSAPDQPEGAAVLFPRRNDLRAPFERWRGFRSPAIPLEGSEAMGRLKR